MRALINIRATGPELERMMNLCVHHNIFIYDVVRTGEEERDEIIFSVKPSDYFKMHSILRKTKTKTVILKKSGLPFFVMKMKKKWLFILSVAFCVLALMFMMQRVWRIEISGNFRITDEAIYDFLEEKNIFYGTAIKNIDFKQVERMLRTEFDEISWASVTLLGTSIRIEIRERIMPSYEGIVNDNGNIVAGKNGVVESIIVRSGVPKVKAGDMVTEGQLLVTNELYTYNDDLTIKDTRYVPCDADIVIRYEQNITLSMNKNHTQINYTGNRMKSSYVKVGGVKIRNPFKKIKYDNHQTITEVTQLCLFKNWYLPVFFGKSETKEYTKSICQYTKAEAEEILNEKLNEILLSLQEKGVQIIEKNVNIDLSGNLYILSGSLILTDSAYERDDN